MKVKNYGNLQISDLKKLGFKFWNKKSKIILKKGLNLILVELKDDDAGKLLSCRPIKILSVQDNRNQIKLKIINIDGSKENCCASLEDFNEMIKWIKDDYSYEFPHWPIKSSRDIECSFCQVREILIQKK